MLLFKPLHYLGVTIVRRSHIPLQNIEKFNYYSSFSEESLYMKNISWLTSMKTQKWKYL